MKKYLIISIISLLFLQAVAFSQTAQQKNIVTENIKQSGSNKTLLNLTKSDSKKVDSANKKESPKILGVHLRNLNVPTRKDSVQQAVPLKSDIKQSEKSTSQIKSAQQNTSVNTKNSIADKNKESNITTQNRKQFQNTGNKDNNKTIVSSDIKTQDAKKPVVVENKPPQKYPVIRENSSAAVKSSPKRPETIYSQSQNDLNYSNLDLKKISLDLKDELQDQREDFLGDLRILWQAAVEKSETIRFAIYKISNPNGDKEKKSVVKKILTPLTSVAPLVGMGSGDPITGGSALIGGGILSSLLADDSLVNSHLSRVTDAELVLLAQEIDDLQQKLVDLYMNYFGAVERLQLMDKIVQNRYKYYEAAQSATPDVLAVADVFYRESIDMQYKARQEALASRAELEQMVGNDVLIKIDKNIKDRLAKTSY